MDIPLKLSTTIAIILSSVAAGNNGSFSSADGSLSSYRGRWWNRVAEAKRAKRAAEAEQQSPVWTAMDAVERAPDRREVEWPTLTRHGYSFSGHTTAHFDLLYRHKNVPKHVIDSTGQMLESAYERFSSDFTEAGFRLRPIQERLSWIVFNDESQYYDFARMVDEMESSMLQSYYAARTNHVVVLQASRASRWRHRSFPSDRHYEQANRTGSRSQPLSGMDAQPTESGRDTHTGMLDVRRAVHEVAHQLAFNTGLQKRGVMYPLWVSEGLATNFECDALSNIGFGGDNPPRQRQLRRAYENDRLMPLEDFVTLVHIRSSSPYSANDLYAQSWAFFNFLYNHRRSELKTYLAALARLEPGSRDALTMRREFTKVFGAIQRLDRAWQKHLSSL